MCINFKITHGSIETIHNKKRESAHPVTVVSQHTEQQFLCHDIIIPCHDLRAKPSLYDRIYRLTFVPLMIHLFIKCSDHLSPVPSPCTTGGGVLISSDRNHRENLTISNHLVNQFHLKPHGLRQISMVLSQM